MAKKKIDTPNVENNVEKFEEINNTPNTEEVINNLSSVDTEIKSLEDVGKEIEDKINKAMEPINVISAEINDINKVTAELNEKITKNPEEAEIFIKSEIQKAEAVAEKLKKVVNKPTPNMTNWWNGMGYDM